MRRLLLHRMPALNNIARLPWIKGNIRKLEKGGSLWEPSRLFDNGEEGAWYDPSDLSTMFQDGSGTTPVTADGQPVGKILDKSGRGNHASQATAAARPLYKTDGTYHWLQFDGVDDGLSTAATTFGAGNFNSVYGMKRATVGNDVVAFSGSGVYFALTATGNSSLAFGTVGSTIRHFVNSVEIGTINATTRNEMHLATPATQKKVLTIKDFLASSFNPLQFGNYGGSYTFEGSLFSYIMADGMTPAEIAQTEAWVNSKTGAY